MYGLATIYVRYRRMTDDTSYLKLDLTVGEKLSADPLT